MSRAPRHRLELVAAGTEVTVTVRNAEWPTTVAGRREWTSMTRQSLVRTSVRLAVAGAGALTVVLGPNAAAAPPERYDFQECVRDEFGQPERCERIYGKEKITTTPSGNFIFLNQGGGITTDVASGEVLAEGEVKQVYVERDGETQVARFQIAGSSGDCSYAASSHYANGRQLYERSETEGCGEPGENP